MATQIDFYKTFPTAFGAMGILWSEFEGGPRVRRTILGKGVTTIEAAVRKEFPDARCFSSAEITELSEQLRRFLEGGAVRFSLDRIALELCGEFQRRVLLAEYGIPRGAVSTYGRIAKYLGTPGGSRAVGNALALNPFPIIIPCHRAVRADGSIGGYQGGSGMKRALLAMEGVVFRGSKVSMEKVHY
jgi:methylated-DNA-[protein]-cysteine S-methyltransferase